MRALQSAMLLLLCAVPAWASPPMVVDQDEIRRLGDVVQYVGAGPRGDGVDAYVQAMAPPASDADKWFISVLTMKGCAPCEKLKRGRVSVLLDDPFLGFLSNMKVQANYASGSAESLSTDQGGIVRVLWDQGAYVDLEFTTTLRIHSLRIFVLPESISTPAGAWQRLVNLGFVQEPKPEKTPSTDQALERAVSEFQAAYGINPTGEMDDRTRTELSKVHEAAVPWSEEDRKSLADDKLHESASLRKDALA